MIGSLAASGALVLAFLFCGLALRRRERDAMRARLGTERRPLPGRGPGSRWGSLVDLGGRRWGRTVAATAGLLAGAAVGGPPSALAGVALGWWGSAALRRRRDRRRAEQLESQLAEGVAGIAAGLRSGLSLSQAIRFVADEGEPPVSVSLLRVVDREAMGVPLDDSLEQWALAERNEDVRLSVSVLQLHHRVGGDTPAILDQVARTLRQRRAAARELRSLTAQARLSGAILGLLPVGFFLFMSIVARSDVRLAYHSPAGLAAILLGLVLDGGAFLWIRQLLRVEA